MTERVVLVCIHSRVNAHFRCKDTRAGGKVLVLVSVAKTQGLVRTVQPAIFHIANIPIENVRVSCEVAEPEFFACTFD